MNKSLKYLAILALIPLFTAGLTSNYVVEADAATRSQGSEAPGRQNTNSYGSDNNGVVCGGVLCKDHHGGKAGWEEDQAKITSAVPKPIPQTTAIPKVVPTETTAVTEKDLGSVLKLSRANIPTDIPMQKGILGKKY